MGLASSVKTTLGAVAARGSETDPAQAVPVPVPDIARVLGLPEEKVAQMIQVLRTNGVDESQLSSMMAMAHAKGMPADKLFAMLVYVGADEDRIIALMRSQDMVSAEEADRLAASARGRAQTDAHAGRARRIRAALKKAAIILFWLAVWQLLDMAMDNRLVLSGPLRVIEALADQVAKPDFWFVCAASLSRIAAGFLLSFTVGMALALASYRVRIVRDFIEPVISLLRTIPVISIIIMLLIWVGNQMLTVYLSFLIVLPLIYMNMLAGLENVDPQMLEMVRVYRLSPLRSFLYVYRPAFMPFLVSSSKLSLGMSWKSGIMAEVLATPKPSIGKEMAQARTYLNTPDLFAWTVVVMLLSWLFERLFMELLKKAAGPLGSFLGRGEDDGPGAGPGAAGYGV